MIDNLVGFERLLLQLASHTKTFEIEVVNLPPKVCLERPSAAELDPCTCNPSFDKNGAPILPSDWDDDEDNFPF